ncbi:uncharacterized protein LOC131264795 [Anopheles coustani]|uniref:uncharacterized protein LOC131264795 n=1 Tax=Anopheles coustani TaxID=139045 RepID=UPI002659AF2D|nr:uncharacterized protein LOC131264795 [Anopheles coustani]
MEINQCNGANETDVEHQNQQSGDLYADFNSFEPNTTVSEAAAKIPMSDEVVFCFFTWVGSGNGQVPSGAVVGGRTPSGENLYIGRVYHGDALLPGKIHPSHKRLYVSSGGKEHYYNNYEVLVEVRRGFRFIAEDEGNE